MKIKHEDHRLSPRWARKDPPMTAEREAELERIEFRKFLVAVILAAFVVAGLLSFRYAVADVMTFGETVPQIQRP